MGICGSLYMSLLSKLHKVEVKTILGEQVPLEAQDKDASTFGQADFILEENKRGCIIRADEELISPEVLL